MQTSANLAAIFRIVEAFLRARSLTSDIPNNEDQVHNTNGVSQ